MNQDRDPTAWGPTVDIGNRSIRIPLGWSVSVNRLTYCGCHDLKQRVALIDGGSPNLDQTPQEGERSDFRSESFVGHLEEGIVAPSVLERILFRRKPHRRFEWVIQHDGFCLVAVYLSDLEDDRSHIKKRVEELLHAIEVVA